MSQCKKAEMICISLAANYIYPSEIRKNYGMRLPNSYNISFDMYYALWVWMLAYFPGFPFMYKHMLVQRQKCLYNKQKTN